MFQKPMPLVLHSHRDITEHITHDILINLAYLAGIYVVLVTAVHFSNNPELKKLMWWMISFAAYLYVGASIFPYLEQYAEIDARRVTRELLQSVETNVTEAAFKQIEDAFGGPGWRETTTSELNWTFDGAAFFSFTLMTTIGYGSFVPKTVAGRVFTMVYAPCGIAIAAITYIKLAEQVLAVVEHVAFMCMRVDRLKIAFDAFDVDGSGMLSRDEVTEMLSSLGAELTVKQFDDLMKSAHDAHDAGAAGGELAVVDPSLVSYPGFHRALELHPELKKRVLNRSVEVYRWGFAIILFLAMVACCVGLSMWTEEWTVLEATYFTVVTFTTIGLGDITPSISQFSTWGLWFYLIGLGVTALLVSALVDLVPAVGEAGLRVCCGAAQDVIKVSRQSRVSPAAPPPSSAPAAASETLPASANVNPASDWMVHAWANAGLGGGVRPGPKLLIHEPWTFDDAVETHHKPPSQASASGTENRPYAQLQ